MMPPHGGVEGTYRAVYSPDVEDGDGPPMYALTSSSPSVSSNEYGETILFFEISRMAWVFARRRRGAKKKKLERLYYGTRGTSGSPTATSMLSRHPFFITHISPAPAARQGERSQPVLPPHTTNFQCITAMTPCRRVAVIIDSSHSVSSATSPVAVASSHLAAFLSGNYTEAFQLAGRPVYVMTSKRKSNSSNSASSSSSSLSSSGNAEGETPSSSSPPPSASSSSAATSSSSSHPTEMVRESNAAIYFCRSRSRWMIGPYSELHIQQQQRAASSSSSNNKKNDDGTPATAATVDDQVCHGWLASQRTLSVSPTTDVAWTLMQVKNFNPDRNNKDKDNSNNEGASSSSSGVPAAGDRGGGWERVSAGIAVTRCADPIREPSLTAFDTMGRPRARDVSDSFQSCTFIGNDAGTGPHSGGVSASQSGTAAAGAVNIVHGRSWLGDDRFFVMRSCNVSYNEAYVSESDVPAALLRRDNAAADRLQLERRGSLFRARAPPPGLMHESKKSSKKGAEANAAGGVSGFVANSPTLPLGLLRRNTHRFLEMEIDDPGTPTSARFSSKKASSSASSSGSSNATSSIVYLAPPASFPTSPRQDFFEETRGRVAGDTRAAVSVGGILLLGSAAKRTQIYIFESAFTHNTGDTGGVHIASCSGSLIRSSLLSHNVALKSGGGVHAADTNVSLQHITCRNNFALQRGGCGFGDHSSRIWVSIRSELTHNNAGREGTTFASLCQVSIADARLHQLVGYAFAALFLALSGSDLSCMHGMPANYLGGYGCIDDAGFLSHPHFSPFSAMEIVPPPHGAAQSSANQALSAMLGTAAKRFQQRAQAHAADPGGHNKPQEQCVLSPPTRRREPGEVVSVAETVQEWLWEPVMADSLWIQASRAASFVAQAQLTITMFVFSYHHLWLGAPVVGPSGREGGGGDGAESGGEDSDSGSE